MPKSEQQRATVIQTRKRDENNVDLVPVGQGGGYPVGLAQQVLAGQGIPSFIANEFASKLGMAGLDGPYLLVSRRDATRASEVMVALSKEIQDREDRLTCLDCDSSEIVERKKTFWERLFMPFDRKAYRCRTCGYRWAK